MSIDTFRLTGYKSGMPRFSRLFVMVILALVCGSVTTTAGAAEPRATMRATASQQAANLKLGTKLVTHFWSLLAAGNADNLKAFLSPAFQVQRANGSGANRNQYVAQLTRSTVVSAFVVNDFIVTRNGDSLVARYYSTTTEIVNGSAYAGTASPRLSSFIRTPSGWKLLSHASFNVPS